MHVSLKKLIVVILLTALQSTLIFTRDIHLFPEVYLLPWLTSFGKIPYIDYIDHHGFLLNFILAPFSRNPHFLYIQTIFFLIQTINLLCFIKIFLHKLTHAKLFILGLFFVLIQFFLAENNLWYEQVILTCYLIIYLSLNIKRALLRTVLIAFFAAIASFIKPTAVVILIPLLILGNPLRLYSIFLYIWSGVFLFYGYFKGLDSLIFGLIQYNQYLVEHYAKHPLSQNKFYYSVTALGILIFILSEKSKQIRSYLFPLSITLVSLIYLGMGFGKEHLAPTAAFFIITIGILWQKTTIPWRNIMITFCIYILTVFSAIQAFRIYRDLHVRYAVQHDPMVKNISQIVAPYLQENPSLFIVGDKVEQYYLYFHFNILPQTRYPLAFPFIEEVIPFYEQNVIQELKEYNIHNVLLYHELEKTTYDIWPTITSYIEDHYIRVIKTPTYSLFQRSTH